MAEGQMMNPADVVAQVMSGEHGDWLREAVAMIAQQLMEAEVELRTGEARGERSADRVTQLHGYRHRDCLRDRATPGIHDPATSDARSFRKTFLGRRQLVVDLVANEP